MVSTGNQHCSFCCLGNADFLIFIPWTLPGAGLSATPGSDSRIPEEAPERKSQTEGQGGAAQSLPDHHVQHRETARRIQQDGETKSAPGCCIMWNPITNVSLSWSEREMRTWTMSKLICPYRDQRRSGYGKSWPRLQKCWSSKSSRPYRWRSCLLGQLFLTSGELSLEVYKLIFQRNSLVLLSSV